ncbi:MAG: hypothetical protein RL347_552 [Actinomycetota bacterium]|jgi:hypothetical protein
MVPRPVLFLASSALALSLAGPVTSATADETPIPSSGEIVDVTPTTATLSAKKRHTRFFSANFQADAGETRFVGTELVVLDAKGTSPSELFVGVTLSCTSPSGRVTSAETGRNVWPSGPSFTIPVAFTFVTDAAGQHKCQATVMMCDPGNCTGPNGTGTVRIVTQKMNPKGYSFLYISTALPAWAQSNRAPSSGKDTVVKPGTSYTINQTFDLSDASGPVRLGSIMSITNCIEKSYPTACKRAGTTNIQGASKVTLAATLTQVASTPGAPCTTASATSATGAGSTTITWQQHHAVLGIWVPDLTLSDDPGCSDTVKLAITVSVGKGNAAVIEPGSKAKTTSIVYAIPGDAVPSVA